MNSISLPVVHPPFEKLKRSGALLHLVAALLIAVHALSYTYRHELSPLYFWCELMIALDIFILVFAGRHLLSVFPVINLFFRFVEVLFFFGIGGLMLMTANTPLSGIFYILVGIAYAYLGYCERGLTQERLSIHHTGLSVPGIPGGKFIIWSQINQVDARYDSIHIETSGSQNLDFNLRKNLDFEELEQIHEFCRHYLGQVVR